ncbi:DBP [Titi monkey adenovirus ECC-2011]|uniref:DNA-binding protein n=1 Tax=titi monkey adenovirus 1 TaxID=3123084 RepID=G0ZAI6_9ADEN|nr:DBP [Titi monkey adenovirus ECC-2011]AEK98457.1 DBP [Titi monkey adenovirus ECC-2011]
MSDQPPQQSTSSSNQPQEEGNPPPPLPPKRSRRKQKLETKPELPPSPVSVSSGSSSEEEEEPAAEPEIVKVLFTNPPTVVHADGSKERISEQQLKRPTSLDLSGNAPLKKKKMDPSKGQTEGSNTGPSVTSGAASATTAGSSGAGSVALLSVGRAVPFEAYTTAQNMLVTLTNKFKVQLPPEGLNMSPVDSEMMSKVCQSWLNQSHNTPQLTFTSYKSFVHIMGRMLWQLVANFAELRVEPEGWNPTGCVMWDHQSAVKEGEVKCLHGMMMIRKEQTVEMDVNSENAQRALKEQPQKARIAQNRWGRNVVQLRNEEAVVCLHDASNPNGVFSNLSCGMSYSDVTKAQVGFQQAAAFMRACYPQAKKGRDCLLLCMTCFCNHHPRSGPLSGRQVCKLTPFNIPNSEGIDPEEIRDPVMRASAKYPVVLVSQCCNPVYRNTKANPQRNCDFKISAPDLITSVQLARNMFLEVFEGERLPPLKFPEHKWSPRLQYRNVAFPAAVDDGCQDLFD